MVKFFWDPNDFDDQELIADQSRGRRPPRKGRLHPRRQFARPQKRVRGWRPLRRTALGRLYDWAATVQIPEVTRLASTIDRWSDEVLAYYRTGRASSCPVEAVNGEIEAVDRAARGFRNFHHYRIRILLKTAVDWQTPRTPRFRGRAGQSDPATPTFTARGRQERELLCIWVRWTVTGEVPYSAPCMHYWDGDDWIPVNQPT